MINGLIKYLSVLKISPISVPILKWSVEVEITHQNPITVILYVQVLEPIDKDWSSWFQAGAIDSGEVPNVRIHPGGETNSDGEGMDFHHSTMKQAAIPSYYNATWSVNRWGEDELVEFPRSKLLYKGQVKILLFRFLEAENITITFINFVSN